MTTDTKRLRELLSKATPGPWEPTNTTTVNCNYACGSGPWIISDRNDPQVIADAALIAAAVNALPELLDEVERLRTHVACLEEAHTQGIVSGVREVSPND